MINLIYCDESRQNMDRYMVIGGIVVSQQSLWFVEKTFAELRKLEKIGKTEMKWNKVSKSWQPKYERWVKEFFNLNRLNLVHFCSLIVDMHKVDHKRFNQGDKELGFYKFYYQLLLHCFGKHYCPNPVTDRLIVYPDKRTTSYDVSGLTRYLNAGMKSKLGVGTNPFLSVEPKESKDYDLIQTADILIGAMGYHKNGLHVVKDGSPAKRNLAAYIAKSAHVRSLGHSTAPGNLRFSIWNFRLQEKRVGKVMARSRA